MIDKALDEGMCTKLKRSDRASPSLRVPSMCARLARGVMPTSPCRSVCRSDVPDDDALAALVLRKMYYPLYVPLVDPS